MRTFKMAFTEAHPFARNPRTLAPHKHDNMVLLRKLGRTATAFFPFYAFVLGWPVCLHLFRHVLFTE